MNSQEHINRAFQSLASSGSINHSVLKENTLDRLQKQMNAMAIQHANTQDEVRDQIISGNNVAERLRCIMRTLNDCLEKHEKAKKRLASYQNTQDIDEKDEMEMKFEIGNFLSDFPKPYSYLNDANFLNLKESIAKSDEKWDASREQLSESKTRNDKPHDTKPSLDLINQNQPKASAQVNELECKTSIPSAKLQYHCNEYDPTLTIQNLETPKNFKDFLESQVEFIEKYELAIVIAMFETTYNSMIQSISKNNELLKRSKENTDKLNQDAEKIKDFCKHTAKRTSEMNKMIRRIEERRSQSSAINAIASKPENDDNQLNKSELQCNEKFEDKRLQENSSNENDKPPVSESIPTKSVNKNSYEQELSDSELDDQQLLSTKIKSFQPGDTLSFSEVATKTSNSIKDKNQIPITFDRKILYSATIIVLISALLGIACLILHKWTFFSW